MFQQLVNRPPVSCRVPLQAAKDLVQDSHLPPERGREGTGLPAHRGRRELEAGHQDGPGDPVLGILDQRTRTRKEKIHQILRLNYSKLSGLLYSAE
jgi:hypothetical protein